MKKSTRYIFFLFPAFLAGCKPEEKHEENQDFWKLQSAEHHVGNVFAATHNAVASLGLHSSVVKAAIHDQGGSAGGGYFDEFRVWRVTYKEDATKEYRMKLKQVLESYQESYGQNFNSSGLSSKQISYSTELRTGDGYFELRVDAMFE